MTFISAAARCGAMLAVSSLPSEALAAEPRVVAPITVSAERKGAEIVDEGAAVSRQSLGAAELQSAGARNAADALGLLPGVVTTGPHNSADRNEQVQLRGFDPGYTLVLVNGQRSTTRGADGRFDLSSLGVDQIERVEVVKGPQALSYGADAIGGVVNVVTRAPSRTLQGSVFLGLGSLDTIRTAGSVDMPLGPRAALRLSGRCEVSAGWTDAYDLDRDLRQKTPKDDRRPTRKAEARADLDVRPSQRVQLRASLRYFDGTSWLRRTVNRYVESGTEGGEDRRQDLDATVRLSVRGIRRGRAEATLHVFHTAAAVDRDTDLLHRSGGRVIDREARWSLERIQDTLASARFDYTQPIGARHVVHGWAEGRLQRRASDQDGRLRTYDTAGRLTADAAWFRPDRVYDKREWTGVLGAEYDLALPRVLLNAGVRLEETSSWPVAVTPAAALRLRLPARIGLRVGGGLGYKMPGFEQRTRSPVPGLEIDGTRYVAGNLELRPERSFSAQLGLEQRTTDWLSWSLTGFGTLMYDRIDLSIEDDFQMTGLPLERPVNVGQAVSTGLEASALLRLPELSLRLSYSYLYARNRDTGMPLNESPAHAASALLEYSLPFRISLAVAFQYVAERLRIDARTGIERVDSPTGALYLARLRLARDWGSGIQTGLELSNLLNQPWDRDNDGDTDLPPLGFFVTVGWRSLPLSHGGRKT